MAVISIIMPVYNTGFVIHDTINSILNQTFKDFELLLIDDGSTDGTDLICDEYVIKDSRVRAFHKNNGGICDARNYGLSMVTTKYLTFCDHDDLYDEKLLEKTICVAEEKECDIVKFCSITRNERGRIEKMNSLLCKKTLTILNPQNNILDLISYNGLNTIWNAIYKKDVIIDNNITFDVNYKHGGEDFDFNIKLISHVDKIAILPDYLYTHITRKYLSTSAKLYDDILQVFVNDIYKTNDLLKTYTHLNYASCEQWLYFYIIHIISFILYAMKMKKSKTYILSILTQISNNHALNSKNIKIKEYIKFINREKGIMYLLCFLLYKLKMNNSLLYLLKIKIKFNLYFSRC